MIELHANGISLRVGHKVLLDDVSLQLKPGELIAVLGPNGAGKTSLLRALLKLTGIDSGTVRLDGTDCGALSSVERAIKVSYLPQRRPLAWPNTVYDIVALGRFAHGAALGRLSATDSRAVDDAIDSCDLTSLATRSADSLSGGELARVHFARALAAGAPLLLADEPVAALDPRHQLRIAELIREYVDSGGGALVVLHDVALAARFADRLVWMSDGKIVAEGSPADTLTADLMTRVYGVQARVQLDATGVIVQIEGISE